MNLAVGTVKYEEPRHLEFGLARISARLPHRVSYVMPKQQGAHARAGAHPLGVRCAMPTVESYTLESLDASSPST